MSGSRDSLRQKNSQMATLSMCAKRFRMSSVMYSGRRAHGMFGARLRSPAPEPGRCGHPERFAVHRASVRAPAGSPPLASLPVRDASSISCRRFFCISRSGRRWRPETLRATIGRRRRAEVGRRRFAGELCDAVLAVIRCALTAGDVVQLVDFGSFSIGQRAARTGRNPSTGAEIQIAAARTRSSSRPATPSRLR